MTQDATEPPTDPVLIETIATLLQQIKAEPVPEEITVLAKRLQDALDANHAKAQDAAR